MGTALGVGWARFVKKPRMGSKGQVLAGTVVGILGALYGKFRRVRVHVQVIKNMENPVAFSKALENIGERSGDPLPQGLKIRELKDAPHRVREALQSGDDEFSASSQDFQSPSSDNDSRTESHTNRKGSFAMLPTELVLTRRGFSPSLASAVAPPPSNRWEHIRRVHAQNAPQSSWEVLRRKQAQNTPRQNTELQQAISDVQFDANERAQEQARFDALLEAERKISRG